MNAGTTIRVETDTATPELRKFFMSLEPDLLAEYCGPALQRLTQEHLAALGANAHGYPSTGFWAKFIPNVRWQAEAEGVSISILPVEIHGRTVGLRQAVYGGFIGPRNAKMLAIPISAASYGRLPAEFSDLVVIRTAKGAFLCQRTGSAGGGTPSVGHRQAGTAGARDAANLIFLFKLVPGVRQAGNRAVLPSDEEYLAAAHAAIGGTN